MTRKKNVVTRSSVLDNAKEYVTKDRASTHGDMEDNFSTIAQYWAVHLGTEVTAVNWEDGCGYLACGGELVGRKS